MSLLFMNSWNINAHWDALNDLLCNILTDECTLSQLISIIINLSLTKDLGIIDLILYQ
jgi:hypothetical protein